MLKLMPQIMCNTIGNGVVKYCSDVNSEIMPLAAGPAAMLESCIVPKAILIRPKTKSNKGTRQLEIGFLVVKFDISVPLSILRFSSE